MKVQFIKAHEGALLPKKNHPNPETGDAGFDLFSVEEVTVPAGGSVEVEVGLEVAHITPGFWLKIEGRSGLGFKKDIMPHGGVIDNSYRGKLGVKLFNHSNEDQVIEKGAAVAQFVVHRMILTEIDFAEVKTEGERGTNGFGSSDVTVSPGLTEGQIEEARKVPVLEPVDIEPALKARLKKTEEKAQTK